MDAKTRECGAPHGSSVAVGGLGFTTRSQTSVTRGFKTFLGSYFYLCMALLMAGLAAWGFSYTVDARLLHAKPPRPLLLWFHAAAFSAWIVLFIAQSALVRLRKVSVHRTLGWFGAALAATMTISGFILSVVMLRLEMTLLHRKDIAKFLSVLWGDMIIFGACMALAIYFRKRPSTTVDWFSWPVVSSCKLPSSDFTTSVATTFSTRRSTCWSWLEFCVTW